MLLFWISIGATEMRIWFSFQKDNRKMSTNGKYLKNKKSIKHEDIKRPFPLLSSSVPQQHKAMFRANMSLLVSEVL